MEDFGCRGMLKKKDLTFYSGMPKDILLSQPKDCLVY